MNAKKKYPFAVYATAFHGGRFISRHATKEAAEKAVRRFVKFGCTCGCAGIINESIGESPLQDNCNPYAIGGSV
jgi:hypothetical protein